MLEPGPAAAPLFLPSWAPPPKDSRGSGYRGSYDGVCLYIAPVRTAAESEDTANAIAVLAPDRHAHAQPAPPPPPPCGYCGKAGVPSSFSTKSSSPGLRLLIAWITAMGLFDAKEEERVRRRRG